MEQNFRFFSHYLEIFKLFFSNRQNYELFIKIFKELCTEMGCIDIEESTVKKRVFNIVYHFIEGLRIEYRGPVILPMVDINLFGVN